MQKKGSKSDGFTFSYTQQLSKYLSNNYVIMAGKKQLQELSQHTEKSEKPEISLYCQRSLT